MAKDDFTRTDFDLSPWQIDRLSIFQAAWVWAGIPPTLPATPENEARYPVELAAARGWLGRLEEEAKAGNLPIQGEEPTKPKRTRGAIVGSQYLGIPSRPAEYRMVADDDWRNVIVARADVRAYAESIGERPAFFFPETAPSLMGNSPGAGLGVSDSGDAAPPDKWARGIRRVAFDAAKAIVANGAKLTAEGLGKAMLDSGDVELKSDEYQLKSTDANLTDREMKAKSKTIAGWVTDLKKLPKQ